MNTLKESYIAVFAHFDKDNIIDDYVVEYLKELKKISDKIVFVSDCNIAESEYLKINDLCYKIIAKRHQEYDFGSYKIGISELSNIINDYDNLIIANDSCYVFRSLLPIFEEMESRNGVDFWGLSQNTDGYPEHIQSYFMVFNKKIFCNQDFLNFFADVKKLDSKKSIIENYEIGLTQLLLNLGFRKDSFIKKIFKENPTSYDIFFNEIIGSKFPLLKVEMMKKIIFCNIFFSPNNLPNIPLFVINLIKKQNDIFYFCDLYNSYLSNEKLAIISNHIKRTGFSNLKLILFSKRLIRLLFKNNDFMIKIFGINIFKKNIANFIKFDESAFLSAGGSMKKTENL